MGSTTALAFGTIFCVLSLFFVALSFGTDYWLKFNVDDDAVAKGFATDADKTAALKQYWYHSRHRGLFKGCLRNATNIRVISGVQIIDVSCYALEYELTDRKEADKYSDDYWTRVHLMRATVGFFIVSMVFLFVGCVLGSLACWRTSEKYARNTGIVVFVGAFFAAFGMAVFHGAEYIEKNKIKDHVSFPGNWNSALAGATARSYDWSYIISWVGVFLAAVSAAIFLVCAWLISMREKDEKKAIETYNMGAPNRAYEYVEKPSAEQYYPQPVVTGAYPAPAPAAAPGQAGAYYLAPAYDYDQRAYGDYEWGWQRY